MLMSGLSDADLPDWNKDGTSMEPVLEFITALSSSVDEVVCGAVYSPQDRESVAKHGALLKSTVEKCSSLICDKAMTAAVQGEDDGKCAGGVKALQEAAAKVAETSQELAVFIEFMS